METIYDKRSGKIWFNGELVNLTNAKVHLLKWHITLLFFEAKEF